MSTDQFSFFLAAEERLRAHERAGDQAVRSGRIAVGDVYEAKLRSGELVDVRVVEASANAEDGRCVVVEALDGSKRTVLSPGDANVILQPKEQEVPDDWDDGVDLSAPDADGRNGR